MSQTDSKHTPGPWVLSQRQGEELHILANEGQTDEKNICQADCSVTGYAPRLQEAKANARLIAAAPQLLEALENLRLSSAGALAYVEGSVHEDELRESILSARAAIKAAKGL